MKSANLIRNCSIILLTVSVLIIIVSGVFIMLNDSASILIIACLMTLGVFSSITIYALLQGFADIVDNTYLLVMDTKNKKTYVTSVKNESVPEKVAADVDLTSEQIVTNVITIEDDCEDNDKLQIYTNALNLLTHDDSGALNEAIELLEPLSGWKNVDEIIIEAKARMKELKKREDEMEGKIKTSLYVFGALAVISIIILVIVIKCGLI